MTATTQDPVRSHSSSVGFGNDAQVTERYRQLVAPLLALAKRRLGRYLQARIDPEDIVQSAFLALFQYSRTHVVRIQNAGILSRLLTRFVVREIHRAAERHGAQKRNIHREHGDCALLTHIEGTPTPLDITATMETFDHLFQRVGHMERKIVQLMLQGHLIADVAAKSSCSRWTVRRALKRIGHVLQSIGL